MAPDQLVELLDQLDAAGRIRRDKSGAVTGSAGLSVMPDRHEIELDGRRYWTWCAYDILGIFGGLEASGSPHSISPASGATIELRFTQGRPERNGSVLFRPDLSLAACCDSVYLDWCPNSNLFEDTAAARSWSAEHPLEGEILSLPEASELAASEWRLLVRGFDLETGSAK